MSIGPSSNGLSNGTAELAYLVQSGALPKQELMRAMEHERDMDRAEHRRRLIGMGFALVVALAFLGAAVLLALSGWPVVGTVLAIAELAGLVAVFISGRRR